jgi:hypothetical protein
VFDALLGAAALALLAGVVRHYAPAQTPALPWWLLAPAVLATERWRSSGTSAAARMPSR